MKEYLNSIEHFYISSLPYDTEIILYTIYINTISQRTFNLQPMISHRHNGTINKARMSVCLCVLLTNTIYL